MKKDVLSEANHSEQYFSFYEVKELIKDIEYFMKNKPDKKEKKFYFLNLRGSLLEKYYQKQDNNWSKIKSR